MRAVVISDTHGMLQRSDYALRGMEPFDLIIHGGDHWVDGERIGRLFGVPVQAVAGNCDPEGSAPEELVFTWAGLRILLVHGHRYQVKDRVSELGAVARRAQTHLAIFGHTHQWFLKHEEDLVVLNPGSVARPRRHAESPDREAQPTAALLEKQTDGRVSVRVVTLADQRILAETVLQPV